MISRRDLFRWAAGAWAWAVVAWAVGGRAAPAAKSSSPLVKLPPSFELCRIVAGDVPTDKTTYPGHLLWDVVKDTARAAYWHAYSVKRDYSGGANIALMEVASMKAFGLRSIDLCRMIDLFPCLKDWESLGVFEIHDRAFTLHLEKAMRNRLPLTAEQKANITKAIKRAYCS